MRLGAIGDVLRVLPALRRIRKERPDTRIGWAIEQWVYPVVAGHPAVDRFHVLDRRALSDPYRALSEVRRFVAEARAESYETTLDFHGRFKSGALMRAIGSPWRVGFARGDSTELNHLFTNVRVRLSDRWENRVLRFLHLLEPLGIDSRYEPNEHGVYLNPEIRRVTRALYDSLDRPALAC
jgi:ADP-heptose:LPS heptosyltransferase